MKKCVIFIFLLCVSFSVLSVSALADESYEEMTLPDEYESFIDSLPEDVADALPEGFFTDDPEKLGEAIKKISSPAELLSLLLDGLFGGIKDIIPTLVVALGITLISAVLNQVSSSFKQEGVTSFISRICLIGVIMGMVYSSITMVSQYLTNLSRMAAAYLPLSAILYAIGGNITTAASSSAAFGVCLSVCQFIFTYTAVPVFVLSLSLAIVSTFYESRVITSISSGVKKYYTMLLSLVMTVLSASIGTQTFISAKADNAAMRGARFFLGNFVPISGGVISSSLGAIASGVELIRGCVGIGGIVIIIMMIMPLVSHLAVMKLSLFFLELFGGATGENNGVISQISSLYSHLLGVSAISSSVFILSFGLLGFCASAIR